MFGHDDKDNDQKDQVELGNTDSGHQDDQGNHEDWQHPGSPVDDGSSQDNQSSGDNHDNQDNQDGQYGGQDDNAGEVTVSSDDSPDSSDSHDENHSDEGHDETPGESIAPSDNPAETADSHDDGGTNDLIDIKRDALGQLSPLVGHLDQTPDEKFRTLMMMIQASDNQGLIREAYETAQKIDDEKDRAQALLDIVNEINYFTQNSNKSE